MDTLVRPADLSSLIFFATHRAAFIRTKDRDCCGGGGRELGVIFSANINRVAPSSYRERGVCLRVIRFALMMGNASNVGGSLGGCSGQVPVCALSGVADPPKNKLAGVSDAAGPW